MIFAVGGVPHALFGRFQQQIRETFGDGHLVVARPLRPRFDGRFVPSPEHAAELIHELFKRVKEDPTIARHGVGIIALSAPDVDIAPFSDCFRPFSVLLRVDLPIPTLTTGQRGRQTMNEVGRRVRNRLGSLRKAVKAINSELSARRNRTPLLLPRRNFRSDVLQTELEYLFAALPAAPDPHQTIRLACQRIEAVHPFRARGGSSFFDEAGVRFRAPGRALHGRARPDGPGHLPTCLLNDRFRLGGEVAAGFHYDCTRGDSGRLAGNFSNCHDVRGRYAGTPHLNIATNDYVR
jgi:hypothetical protein